MLLLVRPPMVKRVMIVGERFAELRHERYWTQEELAERLRMSPANVRRLEQSEVAAMQPRNFRRLAELMEMAPAALRLRIGLPCVESLREAPEASTLSQPSALRLGSLQPVVDVDRFHGVSAARPEDREQVDHGST